MKNLLSGIVLLTPVFCAQATDFQFVTEQAIAAGNEEVASIVAEVPTPIDADTPARDVVKLEDGTYAVFNGTFDPVLSLFSNNSWHHVSFPGWSIVNNGTYGGIASNNDFVFVTDMSTGGEPDDSLKGIIQFDLSDNLSGIRFADDIEPIDLALGANSKLYALYPGGSPAGRFIDVYDIVTQSKLETIDLTKIFGFTAHRSIAIDTDNNIYVADLDGDIQKIDAQGNILSETNVNASLYDIDVIAEQVIAGDRFGGIHISDSNLSDFVTIQASELNEAFNDNGVFIVGNSVNTFDDLIFINGFEPAD